MAETITDILKSIDRHVKLEADAGAINRSIGTGRAIAGGKNMRVWVTNRETLSNFIFEKNRRQYF